jgi:hypothetical protein
MSLFGTGMQKIQNLGSYGFETQDLENMRVNSLISLVANTRLGISPYPHANSEEIQRNYVYYDYVSWVP